MKLKNASPSQAEMEEEVTYDDMAGVRTLWCHRVYLRLTGHRRNALHPASTAEYVARAFGVILVLSVVYVGSAALYGATVPGVKSIAMNLVVFSTALSTIHKFSISINQEKGIYRLAKWMKNVKENNRKRNIPPTELEIFLMRNLQIFYYTASMSGVFLVGLHYIKGENYGLRFPLAEDNQLVTSAIITVAFIVDGVEIVFDASCILNFLITFRSELHRRAEEWKQLRYHPEKEKEKFESGLKEYIKSHAELYEIFRDLKQLNNSMFGYQVFAVILTNGAFIYGCGRDIEFLQESLSQVLPVASVAFLEFSLLCWLGEEISFGFHRNVNHGKWYEASLKDKKALTIVLEFSKNPVTLTGFTVFKANLTTFVDTLKQSFSLYTLVKSIL